MTGRPCWDSRTTILNINPKEVLQLPVMSIGATSGGPKPSNEYTNWIAFFKSWKCRPSEGVTADARLAGCPPEGSRVTYFMSLSMISSRNSYSEASESPGSSRKLTLIEPEGGRTLSATPALTPVTAAVERT